MVVIYMVTFSGLAVFCYFLTKHETFQVEESIEEKARELKSDADIDTQYTFSGPLHNVPVLPLLLQLLLTTAFGMLPDVFFMAASIFDLKICGIEVASMIEILTARFEVKERNLLETKSRLSGRLSQGISAGDVSSKVSPASASTSQPPVAPSSSNPEDEVALNDGAGAKTNTALDDKAGAETNIALDDGVTTQVTRVCACRRQPTVHDCP